jgi:hypothetical protein
MHIDNKFILEYTEYMAIIKYEKKEGILHYNKKGKLLGTCTVDGTFKC